MAMDKEELLKMYFKIVVKEGLFSKNLPYYLNYIFKDISFDNKAMLDIGGGCGLFSFFGACMGASKVVCLEPELEGSSTDVIEKFERLQKHLKVSERIRFLATPLQEFEHYMEKFDIIILHNSINHLNEEACINLIQDNYARSIYKMIFQKLYTLGSDNAKLIIVDSSRYNLFALLKIKNPFAPTIEWHKHQSPKYWAMLLSDVGFQHPRIRWIAPNRLGSLGRLMFGSSLTSYFLNSYFCLTMEKLM